MRRYWRDEQTGDIYDREMREYIPVVTEHRHGDTIHVNTNRKQEREIDQRDIEERR